MEKRLEIIRYIINNCIDDLKIPITEVENDDDLFDLGMDSISSIKIVVELEREFEFEFEDEELTMERLRTINNILEYLTGKLGDI